MVSNSRRVVRLSQSHRIKQETKEKRKTRILTVYSLNGKVVKRVHSYYAFNAAPNAHAIMQDDFKTWDADLVEVYSKVTGKVFIVIMRDFTGDLRVHKEGKLKKGE